jgi:precorrin-6A/cobalt-precorrin-6A reductase
MKILILGGTAEARELANRLVAAGHDVTTSLAGRTQDPNLPLGAVRTGGFGGVAGLCGYLHAARIERLVDATHPYAGQMSAHAVAAADASRVPLVRLMRPAWEPKLDDAWANVAGVAEAATALPHAARVLLTTGHAGLALFLAREDCRFIVRTIEAPSFLLPASATLLQTRPPHSLGEERDLMAREKITHLVTKNSGGTQTAAKLEAARELGVAVIMIARPSYAAATEVASVDAAIAAILVG